MLLLECCSLSWYVDHTVALLLFIRSSKAMSSMIFSHLDTSLFCNRQSTSGAQWSVVSGRWSVVGGRCSRKKNPFTTWLTASSYTSLVRSIHPLTAPFPHSTPCSLLFSSLLYFLHPLRLWHRSQLQQSHPLGCMRTFFLVKTNLSFPLSHHSH